MKSETRGSPSNLDWLAVVRAQVESLRYGVIQVVVHGSRVVQIEKTEKVRLDDGEHLASATARKAES